MSTKCCSHEVCAEWRFTLLTGRQMIVFGSCSATGSSKWLHRRSSSGGSDHAISSLRTFSLHSERETKRRMARRYRAVADDPHERSRRGLRPPPGRAARALERPGLLHRLAHGFYCAVPAEHDPELWQPTI